MSTSRILSKLALNTDNHEITGSAYSAAIRMSIDAIACAHAGKNAKERS